MRSHARDREADARDAYVRPQRADLFFDPWLTTTFRLPSAIADNIASGVAQQENRRRRRRPKDEENFKAILRSITANLAYAVVAGYDPPIVAVPLAKPAGKLTRYDRPALRQLPKILELLASIGFVTLTKSRRYGVASTIEPSAEFVETVRMFWGVKRNAFTSEAETVVLSLSFREDGGRKHREEIDYSDDDPTSVDADRYRAEMQRINRYLVAADLRYDGPDTAAVDINRRYLRRHFSVPDWQEDHTIRFDLGGRLFGGFWQDLGEDQRRFLKIDGEAIAYLDYAGMFVRLAYLHPRVGKTPPDGDLYAVPGFEDHRDGVKKVLNAMFFRKGPLQRLPRGAPAQLPSGTTSSSIRSAIIAKHSDLKPVLEVGVGYELFFTESSILVDVLLRLAAKSIAALPMHDGIMMPQSEATAAKRVMRDVSAKHLDGYRMPVARKE